jgi:hypothetical protein
MRPKSACVALPGLYIVITKTFISESEAAIISHVPVERENTGFGANRLGASMQQPPCFFVSWTVSLDFRSHSIYLLELWRMNVEGKSS